MMVCPDCRHENGPDRSKWCKHAKAIWAAEMKKLDDYFEPLIEATRQSTILTAEDYNIRINCIAE